MSIFDKLKNRTNEIVGDPANIIAKDTVKAIRIEICSKCDEKIPTFNICKQCGCFVNAKASLQGSKCPLGKW